MEQELNLLEAIENINPSDLTYEEWCQVGMALKDAGHEVSVWDSWSRKDLSRYHQGECEKKWSSFRGAANPITGGTIVQLAMNQGWRPAPTEGYALEWDDVIGGDKQIIEKGWVEDEDVAEPESWDPTKEIIRYLELLFDPYENVGYVTNSYEKDGRFVPTKGNSDRTAGELIEALNKCKGDIGAVLGDYKEEVGAWIRFNPLDGKGVKNDNVTEFRYALVESDEMSIEQQNAIIRKLELPVACLVHSGKKSLHAIIKVEAKDYNEYRKRVEYLYSVCKNNGLNIDQQNKNPSRLSRLPGVIRNGKKQFIVDTNIGKESWKEWEDWYESETDDMPDFIDFESVFEDLPELTPELIPGILRRGHKMLISGPSKAGKSALLIQLAVAIAEGSKWLDYYCEQGKVLYINLELDNRSFLHRMHDVYKEVNLKPTPGAITVWPLRGVARSIDKLAPILINRAKKSHFDVVIVDPLYKVLTGDENSAEQMAKFFNNFDTICHSLDTAVIYSHHHTKGSQGAKASQDRASGSGVFARDPDALLDMLELHLTDEMRDVLSIDEYATAWKIEGTLREFKKPQNVNITFSFPIHTFDNIGCLMDAKDDATWQKEVQNKARADGKKMADEKKADEKKELLRSALEMISDDGKPATIKIICRYLKDITERDSDFPTSTLTTWLKKWPDEFKKDKDGLVNAIPY